MDENLKKKCMLLAIEEAKQAFQENEVPVGAVLVRNGEILAHDHNRCMQKGDYSAHAELLCMQKVSPRFHGRLDGCELVVTLEPCAMCTGAAINAKVARIIFGAFDPHSGCCGSVFNLADHCFLFTVETEGGLMQEECAALLTDFFQKRRKENRLRYSTACQSESS
jgi:tRNA(adenine34) deaminase